MARAGPPAAVGIHPAPAILATPALSAMARARSEGRAPPSAMNTDITASVKPEYPVVDRNPPFTKVIGNFSALDYLRLSIISVTVGYLSGIKPGIRGLSMVTGGFMYAYQNSAGRLMGFFPNEFEVARHKYNKL